MSDQPYFRPGVGAIIMNELSEVLVFERTDLPGIWQFMQGGLDSNETIEDALWRELGEETGLTEADIDDLTPYPHWTLYEFTPEMRARTKMQNCLGQVHRWFYLRLKPETTIDLSKATHEEFSAFRFANFKEFLTEATPVKRPIYRALYEYHIQQNNADL